MRTSSLCALALSVSFVAVSDAAATPETRDGWFGYHDLSQTLAERQAVINVCRDLGRVNGSTFVCMPSTNTVDSNPNCDQFDFIASDSFCCNKTLFSPQGVLPLPLASQGNCCPASPVEFKSCGIPPTMLCCHPTEQRCVQPTTPGVTFGECEDISVAPTTAAPTVSPTSAPTSTGAPTVAPTTAAPTNAPTDSPTTSPTSSSFLVCPTDIGGTTVNLLPLQDASGFVQCGCSSTCPSNSHCTFQVDPITFVSEGYCCPTTGVVQPCNSLDCDTCGTDPACAWYAMQGCQLNSSLTTVEADCHTCPSNATAPAVAGDIKTGVPGTCMRRCGSVGGKRYFTERNGRDLEFTAAVSNDDPTRWLYNPPNPYNPYYNLYGSGFVPPPPPPPPRDPLPPMSPESCSCDTKCTEIKNADCCNDYQDLCVY